VATDTGTFDTELGPVFHNFVLADEINRAPAKVQSALLESCRRSRSRSAAPATRAAPVHRHGDAEPDRVRGTYPLPEAQVDRFLMKILVDYPSASEEAAVVGRSLVPPVNVRASA